MGFQVSNLLAQVFPQFDIFRISSSGVSLAGVAAASPALGIGFTGFSPLSSITPAVANDPNFGTNVTPPGVDMGCYQTNGTGNQH